MKLIFEKEFVCKDCGFEFDIPENGDLCPNCFSSDVEHTKFNKVEPLKHIEFFPNGYVDGSKYAHDLQQSTLYTTKTAAYKKIENSPLIGLTIKEVEVKNNIIKLK